jgi:hypothetical protein
MKGNDMTMTPSRLRDLHLELHPESHFFTRRTMAFFGDTMANYAVAREPVTFADYSGEPVTCWQLRRKRPVKHGLSASAYFNVETFKREHMPSS